VTALASVLIIVFIVLYLAIACEQFTRLNKTAVALLGGVVLWTLFFLLLSPALKQSLTVLDEHLSQTSEIIFFLLGAMTIVELIDSHHGFQIIVESIRTQSKTRLVWLIGIIAFFVSSVLDNLTSTIVMVSLLRKLIPERSDRLLYGAIVVIAANAGGAWTPIGDVTTTLLWIGGNVTTLSVMRELFLPSVVSLVITLLYATYLLRGQRLSATFPGERRIPEPGARITFFIGVGSLIFVPIFKGLTGMPPYMGMLLGVGILWIATDFWHYGHHDRDHLKIPHALTRIDTSSVLFFLGILLAVGALEAANILTALAEFLNTYVANMSVIALLIGLVSAIVDNVPLVAASISMYDLSAFPPDSPFWNLVAYCAGTGGSILIIGSAAGVAFMGLEKVDFLWYLRKISPIALVSYLAGAGTYGLLQLL
jgi:NhaD family Na+/H+ antiporter